MNDPVLALMSNQHGLVLRRQATETGMSDRAIDRLVTTGDWISVRRGVYTTAVLWEALDEYVGQPKLRAIAASMNMRKPHVLSHDSAALVLGLSILKAEPELVHVTYPGVEGTRSENGVKHHPAPYLPEQVVEVEGLRVLDVPRTACDIAREHGERHGLVACDAALRMGFTKAQLYDAVRRMAYWPHVTRTRWCVEAADGRAESAGETLTRMLARGLGLGPVDVQFGLTDGRRQAWCDLRIGRHIIEFDGRIKYQSLGSGGVADDPERALWEEKRRQDFICGFKLGMSRVTWVDLLPRNWRATEMRVTREALDTRARFGNSIDDLAPFVIRRPRRAA